MGVAKIRYSRIGRVTQSSTGTVQWYTEHTVQWYAEQYWQCPVVHRAVLALSSGTTSNLTHTQTHIYLRTGGGGGNPRTRQAWNIDQTLLPLVVVALVRR